MVIAERPAEAIRRCSGNAELEVAVRLIPAADALAARAIDAALAGVEHGQEPLHLPCAAQIFGGLGPGTVPPGLLDPELLTLGPFLLLAPESLLMALLLLKLLEGRRALSLQLLLAKAIGALDAVHNS